MMNKKKITVVVETGKDLFSCFVAGTDSIGTGIIGDGKTAREAMADFKACYQEAREDSIARGEALPDVEFDFVLDVGAFLDYYPLNVSAFAKYIGENPSQLRRYASGLSQPSAKTIERIRKGFDTLAHDIVEGRLVDRPVLQYV